MRRLLIIGCGDIALRAAPQLRDRYGVYALTRSRERVPLLRAHGMVPIMGDLDDAALAKGESLPQQLVYISASGVYGDCEGEFVDETRVPRPQTVRATPRQAGTAAQAALPDGARGYRRGAAAAPGLGAGR